MRRAARILFGHAHPPCNPPSPAGEAVSSLGADASVASSSGRESSASHHFWSFGTRSAAACSPLTGARIPCQATTGAQLPYQDSPTSLPHQQHFQTSARQYGSAAKKPKPAGRKHSSGGFTDDTAAATAATGSVAAPTKVADSLDNSSSLYHTNRYRMFYERILFRELMLKCNGRDWGVQPRPASITLTILVADTRLSGVKDLVDKQELLLYLLALEHVAGQAAAFVSSGSTYQGSKAAGVTVTLTGSKMYALLERIVYVVLPSMTGFEGAAPPQRDNSHESGGRKSAAYNVNLKVPSMLLFPDFDANFELFEPLRSVQVQLQIADASSAQSASMLAVALGVPMSTTVVPKATA